MESPAADAPGPLLSGRQRNPTGRPGPALSTQLPSCEGDAGRTYYAALFESRRSHRLNANIQPTTNM